ncbi:MAG TPA: EAL domain-containing protein [Actinomycetota bacterium]|nr:EAL domain-containing protein [Actinomycetota bacterium]
MSTRARVGYAVGLMTYALIIVFAYGHASSPMGPLPAFALGHALISAMISGVTALLMYSHAHSTGRRGYLVIGATFLYLCGILSFFPLYFPGTIIGGQQLWGEPVSAISLYYAWHFAFPVGVSAAALLFYFDRRSHRRPGLTRGQVGSGVLLPLLGVGFTLWAAAVQPGWVLDLSADGMAKGLNANILDIVLVAMSLACVVITAYCASSGALIGRWLAALALLLLGESIVNLNSPARFSAGWYYSRVLWLIAVAALLIALIWNLARIDRANSQRAAVDSLTGSESRIMLLETMQREIERVRVVEGQVALLWIDLDGFKGVNDQLGHQVGDDVLRQVVERLTRQVRRGDHVGRLGGDEFGVLLCDEVEPARVRAVAERLLSSIREPIHSGDTVVHLTAAIGIASAPADARAAEDLLLCADLAMYAAKNRGGDRCQPFISSIGEEALAKASLRHDLTSAMRQDAFRLYYQPIYEADGKRMAGVEVLVRWVRDGRMVAAGEFIPLAEQSGQIITLGRIVVKQLERDLPRWFEAHPDDFFVCLNLSAKELADEALIQELLSGQYAARPSQIVIEVTESLELQDTSEAEINLERLRTAGMRIAIDDFGAGFSNFTRLEHLQPSLLKIDRSLVRRAGSETEGGVAFLTAATSVAASLNCEVVAEGVETQEEAQVVELLGVRYVQGFRYSRPAPIDDFLVAPLPGVPAEG